MTHLDSDLATTAQKIIFVTLVFLVAAIAIAGVWLTVDFQIHVPQMPTKATMTDEQFKTAIGNFKELVLVAQTRSTSMYDLLIKPLLSLFTSMVAAVLTFVFSKALMDALALWRSARP